MRVLSEEECRNAMKKGEFEPSEGNCAIILAQSWCPQWKAMKNYLAEAEKRLSGLEIGYIEYDQVPWFEEFMNFKETVFSNRAIPYVRYYKNGKCCSWSNFLSLEGFLHRFEVELEVK